MKTRKIYYIVYQKETLRIMHVSAWYDKKTHELQALPENGYVNVTNLFTAKLLHRIYQVNYN